MFDLKLQKISIPINNPNSNKFRLIKSGKYNLYLQSQIDRFSFEMKSSNNNKNNSKAYMLAVKNSQILKPLIRLLKKACFFAFEKAVLKQ